VAGNHDHAIMEPAVQQHVLGLAGGAARISFASAADRPDFKLYAEHGNQFDFNNRYRAFGTWDPRNECRGYYFVRYFWNWLEYNLPYLTDTASEWTRFWREIRNHPKLLPRALTRFAQYVGAVKMQVVMPFEAAKTNTAEWPEGPLLPPGSPTLLLMGASGPNVFTDDSVMEQAFREAYHSTPEMKATVDEILLSQGRTPFVPRPVPVAEDSRLEATEGVPKDVVWSRWLFTEGTVMGGKLDSARYRFVLLGHTHDARDAAVPGLSVRYVNTGTWTHGPKEDAPVVLEHNVNEDVRLDVHRFTARGTLE
jgi:hypothetical protein